MHPLDHTPVLGDQNRRWESNQPSKLVSGGVVAQYDWIVHGLRRPADIKSLFSNERSNSAFAFLIHGHEPPGTLPKPTVVSDGDAAATERAIRQNPGGVVRGVALSPAALRTRPARRAAHPSLPESARLSRPPPLSSSSYARLPD